MTAHARTFEDSPAVRSSVPLLIGLMGPSGGGKTYSALRLAKGVQTVTGGDIYVIDTEAGRATHYADMFKFRHLPFGAPFGSLDYLAAIRHCVDKGAGVVAVDSMSHEHEGPGGLLDLHDQELQRMAGNDAAKRERVKMLAWQKPKQHRRELINALLQMRCNFIFCFRAKQTAKPMKVNGKTEVVPLGYMPIAGDEFVFEQTVNCLLLPGAGGVPTWKTENVGERSMMKLPEQFKGIFRQSQPLSEDIGRQLALWAKGEEPRPSHGTAAADGGGGDSPPGSAATDTFPGMTPEQDRLLDEAWMAAESGHAALRAWYSGLTDDEAAAVLPFMAGPKKRAREIGGAAA